MTLALFTLLSLAAAQLTMKAVPFGQPGPATTLSRVPVIDAALDSHPTEWQGFVNQYDHDEISDGLDTSTPGDEDVVSLYDGNYVPYEITEDQTLVERHEGLAKRVPAYRGKMKLNCMESPQACQNACFYQNCIEGGRTVYYYEPGTNTAGRGQAGVGVSLGTPCQTWPFGQKFWDSKVRPGESDELELQTDEWPMQIMQRPNFNPNAPRPQVSLRCIPGGDNGNAGGQIMHFRRAYGKWGRGGRFASDRLGNSNVFAAGDWYDVEFYMGDFDMTKTAHRDMYNKMTACHSPPNCANDGYQFHMTALRSSGQKGKLAQPYDTGIHNTYRLAGQQADIRQFHIEVDVSGATNDQVSARVYHHFNKQKVVLAEKSRAAMAHGTSFTLPADNRMPRDLRVTRQSGGCADFFFNYGNTNIDWFRSFHFKSQDTGWKPYGRFGKGDGRYCITQSIPDPDPKRKGKFGTRLTCSFPAW